MIKLNLTITFSKIIASATLLAGTILSWYTKDSAYFVSSIALSTTVVTAQNAGNAYVKAKSSKKCDDNIPIE